MPRILTDFCGITLLGETDGSLQKGSLVREMVIKEYTKDQQSKLTLSGRFDFSAHKDFRAAYEKLLTNKVKQIVLDLNSVEYLDSSALGMLLQFKDKADASRTNIVIESRNAFVNDILATANFQKILTLKK